MQKLSSGGIKQEEGSADHDFARGGNTKEQQARPHVAFPAIAIDPCGRIITYLKVARASHERHAELSGNAAS